jgi:hypothetical protein
MNRFTASLSLLLLLGLTLTAAAQTVPRIKGRIVDFDGLTFHLAPEGGGAALAIRLQPHTAFMTLAGKSLSDIKAGAYAGATVRDSNGVLTAEEIHLYPDFLRGSSEGRIADGPGRAVISGAVTAVAPGSIALFYRGARAVDGVCRDRADPSLPSPPCTAHPTIAVPRGVPVTALVPASRALLKPGAIATVSVETDAKGVRSTPGLTLEKP